MMMMMMMMINILLRLSLLKRIMYTT